MSSSIARAIVLAAGCGRRLGPLGEDLPKCLLRFGGKSLLEWHLQALRAAGVREIAVVVGYRRAELEAALAASDPGAEALFNPAFEQGSVLSLGRAGERLRKGGDVLVMDADVLCPPGFVAQLAAAPGSFFLLDRDFDDHGAEAVKLCVRGGRMVEFRKQVAPDLSFDFAGESIGFFRFEESVARDLAARCEAYAAGGRGDQPYEEAIRDLLLEAPQRFAFYDVTGQPWIEIDFPGDVERARSEILPRIRPA